MKGINQYNFDIIHVATHLRDTLEYALPHEHDAKIYEQRKAVLKKGIEPETPLGKFLEANKDKFEETIAKYHDLLEDVYGEDSTILVKTQDGKIRVDHTQNLRIYELVTGIMEPLRDIIYFHLNLARKQNDNEPIIEDLMKVDDAFYRLFAFLLILQDFQKSFFEFQKVVEESHGQPSPQSNFIVQNELSVMAKMLRDIRSHNHCTENRILDTLDEGLKVVEMTEGKRDRIDNKPFPDMFNWAIGDIKNLFVELQPKWQEKFNKALQEMLVDIRNSSNNKVAN